MINISSAVRAPMEQCGKMGNFYDKKVWKTGISAAVSDVESLVEANTKIKDLMKNRAFRAYHNSKMWYNRASLYRVWKIDKEMKTITKFLNVAEGELSVEALNEVSAALKYNPKASRKAPEAVANSTGKSPREVRTVCGKVFKFR